MLRVNNRPNQFEFKLRRPTTTMIDFSIGIFVLVSSSCLSMCIVNGQDTSNPIVTLPEGQQLLGSTAKSRDGRTFYSFLGVPFGQVTARFQAPLRFDVWEGLRNATTPGPVCLQPSSEAPFYVGTEECLVMDIHTPNITSSNLPVIFYVHGGGFLIGAGTWSYPAYLMDEDVILVTPNYRLGAFGFLNFGIRDCPGNQAGKDIALALEWVRDNIAAFGGNPLQVTVQGESAGAALVSNLIYSPMTRGLFVNVILQSGTSIAQFALNPRPKYYAMLLAYKLNCTTDTDTTTMLQQQQIVTCLRNKSAIEVLNALDQDLLAPNWDDEATEAELQFNFSVEDQIPGETAFLPDSPINLISRGEFDHVSILIGGNKVEAFNWAERTLGNTRKVHLLNTDWNRVAPIQFSYYDYGQPINHGGNYQAHSQSRDHVSQRLRQLYLPSVDVITANNSFDGIERGISDQMFVFKARKMALILSNVLKCYLYMFDKKMHGSNQGPFHAEELYYLFNYPPPLPQIPPNSSDYTFSKTLIRLWVSFAKFGSPFELWGNQTDEWMPVNSLSNVVTWYHIDDDGVKGRVEEIEFRQRMDFWDYVDNTYHNQYHNNVGVQVQLNVLLLGILTLINL